MHTIHVISCENGCCQLNKLFLILLKASNRIRTTAQENAHLLLSDVPSLSDSSNDEPSTSPYQQLIKQPDPPSDETMRPLPHGVLLGSSVMDETSPTQSFKPKANSTAIDTITGPGDHTALSETQLLESNNHKNNIENLKESRNRNKEENGNEDNERDENEEDTLSQTENEEIDEEIEDDELTGVTDEGTLFEETPHSNGRDECNFMQCVQSIWYLLITMIYKLMFLYIFTLSFS